MTMKTLDIQIPREEVIAIVFVVAFCVAVGAVVGWGARSVSTRDKYLSAMAARYLTEQEYYQVQINQIIREGSREDRK